MFMPEFLNSNEEWVIFLLGDEFHGTATPEQIRERTGLDPDQVEEAARNLELMRAARIIRIGGKTPPENIQSIGLQNRGNALFEELKNREQGSS